VNPLEPIGIIFHNFFYQPVYNLLVVIYHLTGGFAISVVVVTLLLRACLIPLTRKQLKSSREMQVLQPKLKELQQRYRGNPQQLMEEQRRLYKEHGVSPLSGCLPLLVQLPVLYALYGSFLTIVPRTGKPTLTSINKDIYWPALYFHHMPDLHFLYLNLGVPDPIHLLPILAGVLTFVQLRMAMPVRKQQPGTQQDSMTQATSMMQWIMPFMTFFIGLNFAAGLALYWCISTGFSVVQQYFINGRNLGSLFLNIPGLEHLVPEPKELPTATALASRTGGTRALTAASSVQPSTPAGVGRLRALWRQMREAAATQQAAMTETQAGKRKVVEGSLVETDAPPENGQAAKAIRPERRPRPRSGGAMLVKPSPSADTVSEGVAFEADSESADATDEAIRAATDTSVLPEQAAARNGTTGVRTSKAPSTKVPGTNGKTPNVSGQNGSGRNGAKPVRAAAGGTPARSANGAGSPGSTSGQRKPASRGPAGRGHSGRSKGGR
jgi:YidC/Oxa1 family membrane protein insertase